MMTQESQLPLSSSSISHMKEEEQEEKDKKEEISKVLQRMKWESEEQCKSRQAFLHKVMDDYTRRLGSVDVEEMKLLSCLYYNVKYLQCTYDPALLQKLQSYDKSLLLHASHSDPKRKRNVSADQDDFITS
ncbi:hypothetical protein CSUI_006336 [Cystoisospora suis]|uniref:XRN2-binding (XTBD) domain-containing protein n=1 Tax=Cystoisospora suis TaxID=483139 RepID=A0A2C6KUR6_9APIC|nr:hypothetical protein CSUI_006336 [Cystoisospora suis]